MAEIVIDSAVQVLVENLIAVASEEIGLILGVKEELASLKDSFTKIQAFLNDASKRQVEEEAAKLWLKDLESIAYEADTLLDEFNYEIVRRKVQIKNQMKRKVCFFFCFSNPVLFRSKLAHKIKNLNIKLKKVNDTAVGYLIPSRVANSATFVPPVTETDSVTVDPIVVGREKDVSMIVDMLVNSNDKVVSVVPFVGMGGLGKTTFGRLIFNDQRMVKQFHRRIWVCVSQNFDSTTNLFKRILESVTYSVVQFEDRETILQKLKEEFKDKRFLLVLDDLWNDEQKYWEDFRSALVGINSVNGNFIIVTTRSKHVASIVNPRKEIDDWTSVLQSGFSYPNGDTGGVLQVLKLSFDRLPSPLLKKCFAYCSIFSEDDEIEKELLIQLWIAEGLLIENDGNDMESLGSRVYDILLQNCFFQEAEKNEFGIIKHSKMHDLVHDLACSISKAESFNVENHKSVAIPPRTLKAFRCFELQELPSQLRSLISLRHLIVDPYRDFEMPLEIGKLTCLRTLKFFNVGHENGRRIEELGHLKNLKGKVAICKLEHVHGKEEAARACLIGKPNIHKLKLVWSHTRECNSFNDEQVLEGLEPHPNIKSLRIQGFCGDNLPSWIMNRSISEVNRLEKLIELELIDCERCLEIPTLGHLPHLKFLELRGLRNVKSIESMTNLEEWIEMSSNDSYQVVNAFPRLEYLEIDDCPNISRFPSHDFPCLKELQIISVERGGLLLDRICNNNSSSLTSLRLDNVSDVTCLPKRLLYDNQRIMFMYIFSCSSLTHIELSAHNLESLEKIYISNCKKLKSIRYLIQGEEESGGFNSLQILKVDNCDELSDILSPMMLESCTSLQTLWLSGCHNLVCFPIDFRSLPSCLLVLGISRCPKLTSLPKGGIHCLSSLTELCIGPFSEEVGLTSFYEIFRGIQQLHSLAKLELYGWPQFESLPDHLQHLTTLKEFRISNFGMEALPEWIRNLASLECLGMSGVKPEMQTGRKRVAQHFTYLNYQTGRQVVAIQRQVGLISLIWEA
ncbi:Disease resistance protein RGA2 [Sesamum angolense]|uniref:Disease resistance protein RGA2 n=1 Tax=Sesamum angolense TaxID=2727404 RepID=A0AAE1XE51_9LAMI|nr:Disease resistance protein RGA2 [Sesamum angolense]